MTEQETPIVVEEVLATPIEVVEAENQAMAALEASTTVTPISELAE